MMITKSLWCAFQHATCTTLCLLFRVSLTDLAVLLGSQTVELSYCLDRHGYLLCSACMACPPHEPAFTHEGFSFVLLWHA